MKQFKVFTDFIKEEQYLNEKAKNGLFLKKYTSYGVYHFESGQPKDLKYRIDYRLFKSKSDFNDYLALFEDAGWIHVYGTKYSLNQYFIPKNQDVNEDIFSTKESAAARYKTCYEMCLLNVFAALIYFFAILAVNDFDISNLGFLTPGLWTKQGSELLYSFIFELPFVLFRIGIPVIFLLLGLTYAVWANRAKQSYKEFLNE